MVDCKIENCEFRGPVVGNGFCDAHYRRHKKYGDPLATKRPNDWGARHKHPLYGSWVWFGRTVNQRRVPEWDDFWTFVKDVGEKPSPDHVLHRKDESQPHGPDNSYWRKVVRTRSDAETRAHRRDYIKEWRSLHPHYERAMGLWKYYRMTIVEYDALADQQGHVCAICRQPESERTATGDPRRLAVDHCHETGEIRGLLCGACNKGLGYFKNNRQRLIDAVKYLGVTSDIN